eukprot:sb/3468770/
MSGDEEIELEPHIAATVPFVQTTATTPPPTDHSILMPPAAAPTTTTTTRTSCPKDSPPTAVGNNLLKTPIGAHRNGSVGSVNGSRRGSLLSVADMGGYDGSRRPSALDILSHAGSETAAAAVSRAKERRKLVIIMQKVSQILLYVLPTLIVICLILYWTLPENQQWLTMMAAVLGVACVIDFIFFQYFTNRVEDLRKMGTILSLSLSFLSESLSPTHTLSRLFILFISTYFLISKCLNIFKTSKIKWDK